MAKDKPKSSSPADAGKRGAMVSRTQKRKDRNVASNGARRQANLDALGSLYNPYAKRTVTFTRTIWAGNRYETREFTREVSLAPSKQLERARFESRILTVASS